jgi:hypothetical protein
MTTNTRPTLATLLHGIIACATAGAMLDTAPMLQYLRAPEDDPHLRGAVLDSVLAVYMPDGSNLPLEDVHELDDILSTAWHDRQG